MTSLVAQFIWARSLVTKCEPVNELIKNAHQTKAVACEEINKNGQCKEAPAVDPNAMKKRIENYLKVSEDPQYIERMRTNWDLQIKYNPQFEKFYAERDSIDKKNQRPPVPLMKWFSDPIFSEFAKGHEDYKKAFIEKYVAYSQKYDCVPTFDRGSIDLEPHPAIKSFSSEKMGSNQILRRLDQMKTEMQDPKNIQALNDHMKKMGDQSLDRFYICTTRSEVDGSGYVRGLVTQSQRSMPCAGNFKKNFLNNKHDVSPSELSNLLNSQEAQAVSACIKERLAQGAKVHHISITSSASSLNNTGDSAIRFCKKGFLGLSTARAETARDKILPGLFKQAGQMQLDMSQVKIDINPNGSNGDGTSGDCPYIYKNGQEILKPYYNTKTGQEELDQSRYVKIQVTFEDNSKKINDSVTTYQPMYRCKKIELKCE